MIKLRPYQQNIIDKARAQFAKGHKRVLVQLPTGGGKTFIAGFMLLNKPKKSFFIVNRIELIEQTLIAFERLGLDCGIIASGLPEIPDAPVQICSVDTLKARIKHTQFHADFVIWDECRGIVASGWQKVMAHFGNAYHLGLDATPVRTDGKPLGDFFNAMVQGPQISELIKMGSLAPPRVFGAANAPDLSNVRVKAGEYVASDVEGVMSSSAIIGDVIQTYQRIGEDRQGIIFCPTIAYSQYIAEQFTQDGVICKHLDGETTKGERDKAINDYRAGNIRLLTNVGLFTAGFDVPNVGYIADLSPTKSLANYLQRAGRAARPADDKKYYILADHAGNRFTHGFPDDDREWSLHKAIRKTGINEVKTRVKDCPECFMTSKAHRKQCEHCGHVLAVQQREIVAVAGDLQECERLPKMNRVELLEAMANANTYEALREIALRQGYKQGWVYYQWQEMKQKFQTKLG